MKINVGETWKTRGGWLAEVIYELNSNVAQPLVVIHKPENDQQSVETHCPNGQYLHGNFGKLDLVSRVDPKPLADQLDELFTAIAAAGHGVPGSIRLVEEVRALEGGAK